MMYTFTARQDKACRVLRRLDVSRHLWFYDIPASALGDYGYTGPDLVLDMLDRFVATTTATTANHVALHHDAAPCLMMQW